MNLNELMQNSGLVATQKQVYEVNINEYAQAMGKAPGETGAWDWNKTATDAQSPMIKDPQGNIIAGHHRFIAAEVAGVKIPDGVVRVSLTPTLRLPRSWDSVAVLPGRRP